MLTNKYPIWVKSLFDLYENLVLNFNLDWEIIDKLKIHWSIKEFSRKMLSQNPKERLSHSDITKICLDFVKGKIFKADNEVIKIYLETNGNYFICLNCKEMVSPVGAICPNCGIKELEWINPFI